MGINEFDNIEQSVYNDQKATKMSVDSHSLFVVGQQVYQIRKDISGCFDRIGTAWDLLTLGWTGKTQTESKLWHASYMTAVQDFFGEKDAKPDNPKKNGVLNEFTNGLKSAGNGYAQVESSLVAAFEMFADALLELPLPQGGKDGYIPPYATWNFDNAPDTPTLPEGKRDSPAPPIAEKSDTEAKPWLKIGDTANGTWSWTEKRDGPFDLKITVEKGAVWTGEVNDKVKAEWIYDDTGKPVPK